MNGLSTQEVLERQAKGLGNRDQVRTSRSYFQIVRENVFTFVNLVLLGLGTALVLLGRPSDAVVSVLVIPINVIVSVAQEIRAKRALDRIALLTRPKAAVLRDGQEQAVDPDEIVLGDILVLRPGDQVVVDGQVVEKQIASWADQGLRVLVSAANPEVVPLADEVGQPRLPEGLVPFGLVSLREELRPEAQTTRDAFAKAGVRLKIISGDSPRTLDPVARRVGFPSPAKLVSGLDLQQMSADEFAQAAREGDIFGRITPAQKERLVQALRDAGHYVAMVGDGVNDVLALKRANLAVAMEGGSQATRAVADIVLLDDSFAALPPSVEEGRRIITGMQDILKLFLTRVFAVTLMILSISEFFDLAPVSGLSYLLLGVAAAAWAFVLRWIWRAEWMERFLDIERVPTDPESA